jgi:SSS family solute:Na+ symporter
MWILQTLPAVVFGLFFRWWRGRTLLIGWAAGMIAGTWVAWTDGLKPVHNWQIGDSAIGIYTGLVALALNVLVAFLAQLLPGDRTPAQG